jgi:ligand-binding sensor domain-containing protein
MNLLDQLAVKSQESLSAVTPRPHRCTTYDVSPTFIDDIEIAPDRTVWIASRMGAIRYDPIRDDWTTFTSEQGLPSDKPSTVTIEGESVWLTFRDKVGVSHHDGERWRTYTTVDGLPSNEVFDMTVDADGTAWFATREGVSRWDRAANTWTSYDKEKALAGYQVLRIRAASDGSIWFSGIWNATHLTFDKETGEPVWKTYDESSVSLASDHAVSFREMVLAYDGKVWVKGWPGHGYDRRIDRIIVLDPEMETWSKSSCCQWSVRAFAPTENGGLWVGDDHGVDFIPQPFGAEVKRIDLLYLNTDDGLASNDIWCIAVESDVVIWVGTDKGVSRCEIGQ